MDFSVFLYRDDILWITAFTLGGLTFALGPIIIVHLFMPRTVSYTHLRAHET